MLVTRKTKDEVTLEMRNCAVAELIATGSTSNPVRLNVDPGSNYHNADSLRELADALREAAVRLETNTLFEKEEVDWSTIKPGTKVKVRRGSFAPYSFVGLTSTGQVVIEDRDGSINNWNVDSCSLQTD